MSPRPRPRFAALLTVALTAFGCAGAPVAAPVTETEVKIVKNAGVKARQGNLGRILGTISADAETLKWAGISTLAGTQAQAFDQDGTPLAAPVTIDGQGHFVMADLRDSRSRIFIEADVNGLRYRVLAAAPRARQDYGVNLDAGSTYLADKLRRSAFDEEVVLDKLDPAKVGQTEDIVNVYMSADIRRDVLEQDTADLNAYGFDHFMDDNIPVKVAVYQLAPATLRGWRPNLPQPFAPASTPTPTPRPNRTPDPTTSPTPTPTPTGPAPK